MQVDKFRPTRTFELLLVIFAVMPFSICFNMQHFLETVTNVGSNAKSQSIVREIQI